MKKILQTVLFSCVLTNCANQQNIAQQLQQPIEQQPLPELDWQSKDFQLLDVLKKDDIFELNESAQQAFYAYFNAPENQHIEDHVRLYNYIDQLLDGFSYKGDTYSADVASTMLSGNCLSLAILTKGYADLANLKVKFYKVNSAPIYQRENGVTTISSHVQTHIFSSGNRKNKNKNALVIPGKVIIDYFPSTANIIGAEVSENDFISMYYQNLAAKALINKEFDLAYSLLVEAMNLSPTNLATINSLAVLYKKAGLNLQAESLYRFTLNHTKGSVNLLSNYIVFLRSKGELEQAEELELRYQEIEDDNPYKWFDLANKAFNERKFKRALRFYEKSIEVAPYLHESFFGQAKTFARLGYKSEARDALEKAVELAFKASDEKLYYAKLQSL
ncbi:tetratricopeptide repeat protein [Paraglaciecola aestuariivivens]